MVAGSTLYEWRSVPEIPNLKYRSQSSWPPALCVFDRHSPSSNHQSLVSVYYNIDTSLPSQSLRNRNSPHKPNWPLNPKSYHPTIKSAMTNGKSEFLGKMERQVHCMLRYSPRFLLRRQICGWGFRCWLNSHHIYLRDHCRCSECFHPITKQRLLNTFEVSLKAIRLTSKIPPDIKPTEVDPTEEQLHVKCTSNNETD